MALTTDFLIIGGGVIGLNLALQIRRRHSASKIILIEKESHCGKHASGRNSGVLHAGFYYTADSLKARFTREGNSCMTEYCRTRGLRINRCGKLVVAKDPADLAGLEELLKRAQKNGVELHEITDKEARAIEPRIKTYGKALYSPTTASVDPGEVMISLVDDAQKAGINILTNTAYRRYKAPAIVTNKGRIAAGYVINAAGLYADKIAQDFGFSKDYRILPFKGIYLYSSEQPGALKTNIYPVPDLNHPFLGVHYTLTVGGKIKIGPTAIPAFWREHYQGLDNFNLRESIEILGRELGMFLRNDFGFRSLAFNEIQKHFKSKLLMLATDLITGVSEKHYQHWGSPGIRAQLVNIKKRKLQMDFCYEGDHSSFHILNAVSPAFTCAMPFSEFLLEHIEQEKLAA
jgi:(S)-2-hydroxyglutarate dehydrogenase